MCIRDRYCIVYCIVLYCIVCITLKVFVKELGIDRQFHTPILRTVVAYCTMMSLNLLVKEIGVQPIVAISRNLLTK